MFNHRKGTIISGHMYMCSFALLVLSNLISSGQSKHIYACTQCVSFTFHLQCTRACDTGAYFPFFLFTFSGFSLSFRRHYTRLFMELQLWLVILCVQCMYVYCVVPFIAPPATSDNNVAVCIGTSYNVVWYNCYVFVLYQITDIRV